MNYTECEIVGESESKRLIVSVENPNLAVLPIICGDNETLCERLDIPSDHIAADDACKEYQAEVVEYLYDEACFFCDYETVGSFADYHGGRCSDYKTTDGILYERIENKDFDAENVDPDDPDFDEIGNPRFVWQKSSCEMPDGLSRLLDAAHAHGRKKAMEMIVRDDLNSLHDLCLQVIDDDGEIDEEIVRHLSNSTDTVDRIKDFLDLK